MVGRVILNPSRARRWGEGRRCGALGITRPTFWALVFAVVIGVSGGRAAEVIPPMPPRHFNDYAGIVARGAAQQLDQELVQFERDTSNQIVVAIFPRMQSDSSVEDYTVRVAQAWGVGTKERKNGAVLFAFQESHDLRIVTGYGLEGVLPDALCKRIIEEQIVPRFRQGDFTGGMTAGVHAMLAATRGEYRGTGRTAHDRRGGNAPDGVLGGLVVLLIIAGVVVQAIFGRRRNVVYNRVGRRGVWINPGNPWGGLGGGGGGWGGGGGGGGGGFSGGGGSFGGGGAGGKW